MIRGGRRVAVAGVATAAMALALAACTGAPAGAPSPGSTPEQGPVSSGGDARPIVPLTDPAVLEYCPAVGAGPLDGPVDGVEAVYICAADPILQTGGGAERPRETVDHVVDPAELLEVYGTMDAEPTSGACTLELPDPLILWLDLGEEIVPVRAPHDACAKPTEAAQAAYENAERERVLETTPEPSTAPDPGSDD
ncbi:hypothetical protein [Homoserinibacter sp. YIM 151385]|uniref:hypothetical protein n=1 Tax=Homoserinibacter sp. YIM 151385 TaxID=2985506 RepID=UPI0022F11316|nr:hypothetical protein [Homoserinibacter sp. YIM 151385]WBU39003.1 hypothetical protein OF852_05330 [Homoserinibacter sp. YIM 151385]